MKKRRTLAAFLAFVLMAAVLIVGCQNEGEKGAENSTGAGTTGVGSGTVGTSQEETTEFPYPQIPEGTDYSGRTFTLYRGRPTHPITTLSKKNLPRLLNRRLIIGIVMLKRNWKSKLTIW